MQEEFSFHSTPTHPITSPSSRFAFLATAFSRLSRRNDSRRWRWSSSPSSGRILEQRRNTRLFKEEGGGSGGEGHARTPATNMRPSHSARRLPRPVFALRQNSNRAKKALCHPCCSMRLPSMARRRGFIAPLYPAAARKRGVRVCSGGLVPTRSSRNSKHPNVTLDLDLRLRVLHSPSLARRGPVFTATLET